MTVALAQRLSDPELFVLEMAAAIVAGRASALEEHELEVLAEANRLLALHGREAAITERHWTVIRRAVAGCVARGARPELGRRAA